jgi:thiamin-phosphate kinase
MLTERLKRKLRFYFITDDLVADFSPLNQTHIAVQAGATIIQYRNKSFSSRFLKEVYEIRDLCKCNAIPFIVNDNILLAKAVMADGVHLGQEDEDPATARRILGDQAIIGLSVSNLSELERSDLLRCDYIGTGPVFSTQTKADAKKAIGLSGFEAVVHASPIPVLAIGGIDQHNAESCFRHGASGVAVISAITRTKNPLKNALQLSAACGCRSRSAVDVPWNDEFSLIKKLLQHAPEKQAVNPALKVPPGDDACLLGPINNPVISTDTQKEGVHFRFDWQTPEEVGSKAVEVTFSDLAASYAVPASLFVNIALPAYTANKTVEALYKGIKNSLEKHNCTLGGGNVSAGLELSLDLFVIGRGNEAIFPTRSSALPGYGLYCTGPLGLARAGLDCLIKKDLSFSKLTDKFKSPTARFDAAKILAENLVPCVIDISDGLLGDARHLAEASGLSITFDLDPSTFDPALVSFCKKYNQAPEDLVLGGGEDYELLFACLPEIFEKIKEDLPEAFQVGQCIPFNGTHLITPPATVLSFQHGRKH